MAVADLFTGMYATVAILAALRHAERTGEGQHIDMALLDTQVAMLANLGANYLVSGKVPGRAGNAHQNIVPYQVFEVAPAADGSKDHIILAVGNDGAVRQVLRGGRAARSWPRDPRFASNQDRVRNRARAGAAARSRHEERARKADWLAALEAAKVPCGAINNLAEVFADPHVQQRGMVDAVAAPAAPDLRLVASPIKLSATPVRTRPAAAAARAAHRRRCCARCSGCDDERHRCAARAGGDLMANFVLVHGAWHGGWCWQRVVAAAARRKATASTPSR